MAKLLPAALTSTAFRLAAVTLALFLIAVAGIGSVLFWQTNQVLTEQVLATLRSEVETLKATAEAAGIKELAESVAARSRPEGPGLYFLADASGQKLAGNLSRLPPEIEPAGPGGVFRYERSVDGAEVERLGVAIPVDAGGGARLIVGRDIEEQREFANRIKGVFLWSFGLLSLLGVVGGLAISRQVLNRIEEINVTSGSIMEGDLSRRIPLQGSGDEIDGLAENLNVMLDRIEGLMSGLREVSDNIAHDLRTPLNHLRNAAESALMDPGGPEAYREGLEQTIAKADELIKTFNAILLVARLEARAVEENAERFDLGALVRDVAELYEPSAEEAGLRIAVATPNGLYLNANRQLIGQAVANLIDNAIKYSAPQAAAKGHRALSAPIAVRVAQTADGIDISVEDKGPGIAEGDRERALKRFVRLQESRTQPGAGLGLSLVAAVARLYGGRIRLEDSAPGLRVVLTLPRRMAVGAEGSGARPGN